MRVLGTAVASPVSGLVVVMVTGATMMRVELGTAAVPMMHMVGENS
jgi:hypothetical protein